MPLWDGSEPISCVARDLQDEMKEQHGNDNKSTFNKGLRTIPFRFGDGGRDWTRTSDPYRVKVVL